MSDDGHISRVSEQVFAFKAGAPESSFEASFSLVRGVYELRVIAPFNTQIAVDVLNPVIGFELQGDRDADPHSYNSKVVNPQDGTYTFEITLDKPVSGNQLTVRCNLLSHDLPGFPAPPVTPPHPQPPPAPPQPPPPPPSLDEINQKRYRDSGFEITGDGMVTFYWVTLVRNRKTGEMIISASYAFGASQDYHDPVRTMQRVLYDQDARKFHPYQDFELVSRTEPLPTVADARRTAEAYSSQYYGVPDQYGMTVPGFIKRGRGGQFFQ